MDQILQRTPREELAWLAALLEGEGCFIITKDGYVNILLCMADQDVVEEAHQVAGVGSVTGPYFPKNSKWRAIWRWKVSKEEHVFALCRAILPFMGKRRTYKIEKILSLEKHVGIEPIWVRVDKWERG